MDRYDAIVVGAGQGGIPLATRLADRGWRVALVEREHLGGSCVNYGCTPTKAMLASARAAHVARSSAALGVQVDGMRIDLARVVDRRDEIVLSFREGLQDSVNRDGLELIRGHARFTGPGRLAVGEREIGSDRIVLDVGAKAVVPPIDGLEEVEWLDARAIQELRAVPEHLVVAGGGYIGCEFAQMFRRFGSRVTVIELKERLMAREDPEVADVVADVFRDEGIRLLLGTKASSVRPRADGLELHVEAAGEREQPDDGEAGPDGGGKRGEPIRGTHLLVAGGRRPATDDLGRDAIGLETDRRGAIPVDARLRTEVEGVWAIGDANGDAPFTNVSYDDGEIILGDWTGEPVRGRDERHHCLCAFTDPPLARVGLNEREAREAGRAYRVATLPMKRAARTIEVGETAGLMKVLGDPDSRRILGATVVGLHADEVIHTFAIAMDADAPWDVLGRGVYVHPAVSEAVPSLVRRLDEEENAEERERE